MMCIIHYISAMRRLKESNKTVMMLGGADEAPPMIVAQNEMIRLEMEYYQEETMKFSLILLFVFIVSVPVLVYLKGQNVF